MEEVRYFSLQTAGLHWVCNFVWSTCFSLQKMSDGGGEYRIID